MENILKKSSTVADPRMPLWFGQTVGYKNNQKAPKPSFKGEQFQGVPSGVRMQNYWLQMLMVT